MFKSSLTVDPHMKIKEISFKMESGSHKGAALMHTPLLAVCGTCRRKEDKNYLDKEGHFSLGNFISCF